jgi:hypothetical protein
MLGHRNGPPNPYLGGPFLDVQGYMSLIQSSLLERGSSSLVRAQRAGFCLTSFGRRRAKPARLQWIDFDSAGRGKFRRSSANMIVICPQPPKFPRARYLKIQEKRRAGEIGNSVDCRRTELATFLVVKMAFFRLWLPYWRGHSLAERE